MRVPGSSSVTTLPESPSQLISNGPLVAGSVTAAPPHNSPSAAPLELPTHTSRGERRSKQQSFRFQTTTLKTSVTALTVIESHGLRVSGFVWHKLSKSSSMLLDAVSPQPLYVELMLALTRKSDGGGGGGVNGGEGGGTRGGDGSGVSGGGLVATVGGAGGEGGGKPQEPTPFSSAQW